jgi:hypothetical protein
MAKHVKNERARLVRRMEQALTRLAELDPETVAEFRAARAGLEAIDSPEEERYLRIRGTKDAVNACLEFEGKPLPKLVIADKLFSGGFVTHPTLGRRLIVQAIDKNIQRGNYVFEDDLVYLPKWKCKTTAE